MRAAKRRRRALRAISAALTRHGGAFSIRSLFAPSFRSLSAMPAKSKPRFISGRAPAQKEPGGKIRYVKGASLIDGNGGKPLKDPVVVLEGKRIKQVGSKDKIRIPPGADIVDCSRYTLLPGMIDAHLHTMMFNCLTF